MHSQFFTNTFSAKCLQSEVTLWASLQGGPTVNVRCMHFQHWTGTLLKSPCLIDVDSSPLIRPMLILPGKFCKTFVQPHSDCTIMAKTNVVPKSHESVAGDISVPFTCGLQHSDYSYLQWITQTRRFSTIQCRYCADIFKCERSFLRAFKEDHGSTRSKNHSGVRRKMESF